MSSDPEVLERLSFLQNEVAASEKRLHEAAEHWLAVMEVVSPLQEELSELEDQKERYVRDLTHLFGNAHEDRLELLWLLWKKYKVERGMDDGGCSPAAGRAGGGGRQAGTEGGAELGREEGAKVFSEEAVSLKIVSEEPGGSSSAGHGVPLPTRPPTRTEDGQSEGI